jgi:hypothetical protein
MIRLKHLVIHADNQSLFERSERITIEKNDSVLRVISLKKREVLKLYLKRQRIQSELKDFLVKKGKSQKSHKIVRKIKMNLFD